MRKKISIGDKGKVNIKWNVLPIDYSHEKENEIISKFSLKYNISKDNIRVSPQFISKNNKGEIISFDNEIGDNIQDSKFQQKLFKKYIEEKSIDDVDFDKILEIDNFINSKMNYDVYDQHKRYTIKWVKWSNFMSYGRDNYFDFTTLKGLILLSSDPANQGGKTTFCLDLLRFLLFGKVTSRESDWTLSKVFNKHLPEETEVVVEGCIAIDGVDYVIKRVVSRPPLKKRTDKSKVSQKVTYYKLVNDEYIDLYDEECQDEVTNRETNKAIKDAIGNERDFDLMICVDSDNLKSLISLKDTERGRLISRWIGLLPLEEKEKIARDVYNHEIMPNLNILKYNKVYVLNDNNVLEENNKSLLLENEEYSTKIEESNKKLEEYNTTKETLLISKKNIDESLLKIDVNSLQNTINNIVLQGKNKKIELQNKKKDLEALKDITFDKNEYDDLVRLKEKNTILLTEGRSKYKSLTTDIYNLKKGEFCPTCGAKLDGVDNTKKIKEKEAEINDLSNKCIKIKSDLDEVTQKITKLDENRERYNEKIKLELLVDKLEVDIDNLASKYRESNRILNDIEENKSAIEANNKIEISLNNININITSEVKYNNTLCDNIRRNEATINSNNEIIRKNTELIKTLEKEEVLVKNWKLYLELIGKNGISKLVLRTVLPLINGELSHLLSDVCDFDVKVSIDNHNDVSFYLIHDGVESNLSSGSGFEQTVASLALRSVLSKISTFSKPSFVVFDEVLGGVAEENYDALKRLYDKLLKEYQCILFITHNKTLYEWANYILNVKKENNISKIYRV